MNKLLNRRYVQLIFLCFFAYTVSYLGKLGYTANIQNFINDYGVSKLDAGYASSAFFFCYGAGQFINAIFCEKINSVKIVSFSLLISSIFSLSLFFIKNILVLSVLWGINGLVLSTLWCNIIKITAKIKDEKYSKISITALAVSLPLGTFITYGLSALLTLLNVWRIYFIVSFVAVLVGGILFILCAKRVLSDITDLTRTQENLGQDQQKIMRGESNKSIFKFMTVAIIPFFLIAIFGTFIKDGIQTWMPTFVEENYLTPTYFSILVTLVLPLVGVFSAMIAKWLMYKIKSEFGVAFFVFAACTIFIVAFMFLGHISIIIAIVVFAALSLFAHINNSIITSVFPIYYKKVIKSGQTAGIINGFAYVGSTLSSFLLGAIIDAYDWNVFIYVLLGCASICVICAVLGYIFMKRKIKNIDIL